MKKNGFTLIELLAVIVVLGIIMLIAITAVSGVITRSRLSSFNSSSTILEKAASTYITANNTVVDSGTTIQVLYTDLKNSGFVERVVDPVSKNECINSRVHVTNTGVKYTYKGALVCDNYMDVDSYNLITNSDLSNSTTGWSVYGATHSVTGNILTCTGNGVATQTQEYQSIPSLAALNHKYYVKAKTRVTNVSATHLQIIMYNGTEFIDIFTQANPTQNQWYTMSGIGTFTSGAGTPFNIYAGIASYANASTANGKIMQIDGTKGIYAFDLTAIYGSGSEPTVAQIDKIMVNMGK